MSTRLILLPEAKKDIAEAYSWYEEQSLGLGSEYLRCVEATLLYIRRASLIFLVTYKMYRRALVLQREVVKAWPDHANHFHVRFSKPAEQN